MSLLPGETVPVANFRRHNFDGWAISGRRRAAEGERRSAPNPADYETYGYDANDNPTLKRTRSGGLFVTTFDALNRTTFIDAPAGSNDVAYGYDLLGRRLSATHPGGQTVSRLMSLSHDELAFVVELLTSSFDEERSSRWAQHLKNGQILRIILYGSYDFTAHLSSCSPGFEAAGLQPISGPIPEPGPRRSLECRRRHLADHSSTPAPDPARSGDRQAPGRSSHSSSCRPAPDMHHSSPDHQGNVRALFYLSPALSCDEKLAQDSVDARALAHVCEGQTCSSSTPSEPRKHRVPRV